MKPKKHTKADLNKKNNLFLQIGLILVLLLAYFVIQWKTYIPSEDIQFQATISSTEDETVIPITALPTPPPPEIPKAPKVIDGVPDDTPVIEDPFNSTEKDDAPMPKVTDIIEAPKEDPIAVPFEFIEQVPIFPGCENLNSNAEMKDCMSAKITKFIHKNFDAELGQKLGLSGINRISILFQINYLGAEPTRY